MNRTIRMGVAGVGAFSLAVALPVSSALAQSGDPVITNTETVNVATDSSGDVESASVYDQIAIQGSGDVEYENPVSTAGLRNLDSFAGFAVEDGAIVEATTVDGQVRRRTISDFDLDLPVEIAVVYKLDGEEIDSGDLVGKTGELEVTYIVENMTGEPQEISFTDGEGNEITETQTVYEPMAGSLTFTLPSNFTDVQSESGAVIAGDGRGGTKMTFSVTLIPPLGSPVAEVSYTAGVTDATIPPANLSMIPVVISNNPTASGALESFQGGAETGAELAAGAAVIDENLLALADGASTLLSGLILLRDGSAELSEGLVNTAAPGSAELAAGADELAAGLNGTAVPGSQQLSAGADELAAGLNGTAVPGSQTLAAGAGDLSTGLDQLNAQVPDLVAGVTALSDGADQLQAGLLALQGQLPELVDGITALSDGADRLEAGLLQLQSQIPALIAGVDALASGGTQLSGGLNQLEAALDAPLPDGFGAGLDFLASELASAAGPGGLADQVVGGIGLIQATPDCGAVCQATAAGVSGDVDTRLRAEVQAAADGASTLNGGYTTQIRPAITQLSVGADDLDAGLGQLQALLGPLSDGVDDLVAGANQLADGLATLESKAPALEAGVDDLVAGSGLVADGLTQLESLLGPLSSGVDQLADGGELVASGADQLADGLVGAADGSNQVADGADQLADGLGDAADGSVQVASGLEDAAEAAPALPEGAQRLSEEGSSELIKAGNDTAVTFGQQVAVLEAGAERTADGGLPYGAPEDALRFAAYSYDIAGAAGTTSQNTGRLLWALVIGGGAAAGAAVLAQRRAA